MTAVHTVLIGNQHSRDRAKAIIDRAPPGYIMKLEQPRRTIDQNRLLWQLLTEIEIAKPQGRAHTKEQWKDIFLDAIGIKADWVPSLDGKSVVNTARHSSRLRKSEFTDLIELIYSYAAENGVVLHTEDTCRVA
jgi:hypothetical protein